MDLADDEITENHNHPVNSREYDFAHGLASKRGLDQKQNKMDTKLESKEAKGSGGLLIPSHKMDTASHHRLQVIGGEDDYLQD